MLMFLLIAFITTYLFTSLEMLLGYRNAIYMPIFLPPFVALVSPTTS
jgi:hypothetical protein